jgi:galactose oxidase-like protein/glyoxal oxidase-like protein/PKD domain-containing protein
MNGYPSRLFAPVCLLLLLAANFSPVALAQSGQWQTLPYTMPINPVHVALLYNGKVLIVSGSGNVAGNSNFQAALWDPQTGTIIAQPINWDMFCNGMIVLPDGRPFVMGGTLQYDPFHGELRTSTYDPATNTFTDQQSMAHGRWYPTGTVLGDGRTMIFSGLNETGGTNTSVEFFSAGSGWSAAFSAPWTPPLYPRLHVLSNGKVFYSGSTTGSSLFDPSTHTWTTNVAFTNYSGTRTYGSSVLLPLTPQNNYKPVVFIMGGGNPATNTSEFIDLSAATPKWAFGPNMSAGRIEMNATLLPSGQVLALGGSVNDEDNNTASLAADLYTPNANLINGAFSPAGAESFPRLYHSVSLLLPDATVWVAGGNPARGAYESQMEIYTPQYLLNADGTPATRPTISNVSSPVIGYNAAFQIQTPDAANISQIVLMRNGAATHAFDMDQRYVGLNFIAGSGILNVTGPPNGNIAPPGYYMLFLLNRSGVPSVASMVQLSHAANDIPPSGTITSPASNVTITAGQSVNYSGTGSDTDGTISAYSWSFPGGSPNSSTLANPGNVIYSTPGTYTTTFTVTDNVGLTDPTPPTRTITVQPDFSLSASPSTRTIVQDGGTSYTATVTPGTGFSGTVSLSVGGLPAGATASFSPASISSSGSSSLSVSTSSSTPPGSFPLTVTATSGALTHTAQVMLVVSGDFAITINPSSSTVHRGSSTNYTITVAPGTGFSGAVTFSLSGLPRRSSATFTPKSVASSGSSTMTVVTNKNTPPGAYTLTVTATSGSISHSQQVTLNIQ